MSSRRSSVACSTQDGEDAVGDALQRVGQGLARLQEALRLQKQEAERRAQEAERTMQEALRLQEERLREMDRKLQEKDDAVRSLQQRLQETHVRMTALEERTTSPKGSGREGLQRLEGHVNEGEASLRSVLQKIMPQMEAILLTLEEPQSTRAPVAAAFASARPKPVSIGAWGGGEEPPSSSSTTTPSGAGHQDAAAKEEVRERQRVELRVRRATLRWERAQASPSPLGEQLCEAAKEGRLSDVRHLINSGAGVNYTDRISATPLLYAAKNAHADVVSLLLQRGADVNAVNCSGSSALHFAAGNDSSGRCVELLVRAGADVNARNIDGATPLHRAALNKNEEVVRALLAAGARRDLKGWGGFYKGRTPFETMTLVFRISYDCNLKNGQGDIDCIKRCDFDP